MNKCGASGTSRGELTRRVRGGLSIVAASAVLAACSGGPIGGAGQAASTTAPDPAPGRDGTTPGERPPVEGRSAPEQRDMVRIDGGAYTVGTDEGPSDEAPAHVVDVAPFLIDRYEVTNAQFAEFLNSLGIRPLSDTDSGAIDEAVFQTEDRPLLFEGSEGEEDPRLIVALDDENSRIAVEDGQFVAASGYQDHPVAETSWRGARDFAEWSGGRLPTEAEWEAAASGLEGRTFPWGQQRASETRAVINTSEPAPVGTAPAGATPEGAMGLAGNLAEWTSTLYRPYPYDAGDGREDQEDPGERVTRGGDAYFSDEDELRTTARTGFSRVPGRGHRHIGFRTVRSA